MAGVPKLKPVVDGAALVSAGFAPNENPDGAVVAGAGSAGFDPKPNGEEVAGAADSAGLPNEKPVVAVGVEPPSAAFCPKLKPLEAAGCPNEKPLAGLLSGGFVVSVFVAKGLAAPAPDPNTNPDEPVCAGCPNSDVVEAEVIPNPGPLRDMGSALLPLSSIPFPRLGLLVSSIMLRSPSSFLGGVVGAAVPFGAGVPKSVDAAGAGVLVEVAAPNTKGCFSAVGVDGAGVPNVNPFPDSADEEAADGCPNVKPEVPPNNDFAPSVAGAAGAGVVPDG